MVRDRVCGAEAKELAAAINHRIAEGSSTLARGVDPTRFDRLRRPSPPDSRIPDPYIDYGQTEDSAPSPKKSSTPEWSGTCCSGHNYGQQHRRDHRSERGPGSNRRENNG